MEEYRDNQDEGKIKGRDERKMMFEHRNVYHKELHNWSIQTTKSTLSYLVIEGKRKVC